MGVEVRGTSLYRGKDRGEDQLKKRVLFGEVSGGECFPKRPEDGREKPKTLTEGKMLVMKLVSLSPHLRLPVCVCSCVCG